MAPGNMKAPRYSLRSLFALTFAVALFAAMCEWLRWQAEGIVLSALVSSGVTLFGYGIYARRPNWCFGGGVVLVSAALFLFFSSSVAIGDGSAKFPVQIEVFDAVTKQPVVDANVWLHDGETQPGSITSTTATSDASGRTTITAEFPVSTRDSLLTHQSTVAVGYFMLHVEAAGYRTVDIASRDFWGGVIDRRKLPIPLAKVYLEPVP